MAIRLHYMNDRIRAMFNAPDLKECNGNDNNRTLPIVSHAVSCHISGVDEVYLPVPLIGTSLLELDPGD